MNLEDCIRLAVIRICLWQANRCVRKADHVSRMEDRYLQEAQAWVDCARQHRLEMEGGDAP